MRVQFVELGKVYLKYKLREIAEEVKMDMLMQLLGEKMEIGIGYYLIETDN